MNTLTSSHKTQLIATAVAASATTAAVIGAYNSYKKRRRRQELARELKHSLLDKESARESQMLRLPPPVSRPRPTTYVYPGYIEGEEIELKFREEAYSEELIKEQLARNYAFFGEESMDKIRKGTVVVVGCGGVGSWASVMLVRSGVSKIRLVDFDYVTLSSLNRHATANTSDVGTPKVRCVEKALKQFSRWVEVDARVDIWKKEGGGALLEGADWVIDAIDNITTKVDLLKYCHDHNIKVFSSMGAGAKCDPTRVQISDISYTIYDPLARSVRRRLRTEGVSSGIPVVYSTEVPGDVKLLPLPEDEFQKGPVNELGVFDDFRVRILPVLGPLPSIFGLHIATYILCDLAGKPILNPLPVRHRKKLYERMLRDLLHREEKLTCTQINKLPIDEDDVSLIFEDIHRGRAVQPPFLVPARPTLVRWDLRKPVAPENVIVMEHTDAEDHLAKCIPRSGNGEPVLIQGVSARDPVDAWSAEVVSAVRSRIEEVRKAREWIM